jgi:hypothetical protein
MAVEGYQGYVAPIQGGTSYAQALQERVQFIQDQQRENIASIIANQQKKNEFRLKQLESLYKFRTNGWGEQPIKAFGDMRDMVSQKMKSGGYADIEDFYSDLSKLSDTHAFFSNHYETVKPVLDETAKLMQNPGLYEDKTRRPIDTPETYGQKYESYLNLGMTNVEVGGDLSLTYIDPDGNRVSVYDNPIASNTSFFGPLLDLNFVAPKVVADEYSNTVKEQMDRNMSMNESRAKVRNSLITDVEQNPALMNSAQELFKSRGLKPIEGQPGPVDLYVDEIMALLPFGRKPAPASATRTTGGGGAGSQKTPDIYSVMATEEQRPRQDALNVGLAELGSFGPGAEMETTYEYSLPANAIDPINIKSLLTEDEVYGFDGNTKATVKTIVMGETGMTLRGVLIGNKDAGERTVLYSDPIAQEILQSLQDKYDYQYEAWKNGTVYRLINQQNAGVPPVNRGIGAPVGTPFFSNEVIIK